MRRTSRRVSSGMRMGCAIGVASVVGALFAWGCAGRGGGGGKSVEASRSHGGDSDLPDAGSGIDSGHDVRDDGGIVAMSATTRVLATLPASLSRIDIVGVLSRGFGPFLAGYDVRPAFAASRFRGWKIVKFVRGDAVRGPLSVGDTLLRLNDHPLERPEEALAAFQSLAVATEVKLTFDHGGAVREVSIPIRDKGAAGAAVMP